MKSWRVRGEVDDSEDEDLALSLEEEKNQPSEQDIESNEVVKSQDFDKTEHVRVLHGLERVDEEGQKAENEEPNVQNEDDRAANGAEKQVESEDAPVQATETQPMDPRPQRKPVITYGRKSRAKKAKQVKKEVVQTEPILEDDRYQKPESDSPRAEISVHSVPSSNPDDLPNLSQLITDPATVAVPEVTVSSPLSSLPSVFGARLPVQPEGGDDIATAVSVQLPAAPDTARAQTSLTDLKLAQQLQSEGPEYAGRRLRERTEKQLHPYVYYRQIYQEQWRQRGLRPVNFIIEEPAKETQDQPFDEEAGQSPSQNSQQSGYSDLGDELQLLQNRQSSTGQARTNQNHGPRQPTARESWALQLGRKKRKVSGPGRLKSATTRRSPNGPPQAHRSNLSNAVSHGAQEIANELPDDPAPFEEFPRPMSPPLTCSIPGRIAPARVLPTGFIIPAGGSPPPLPTPGVSSSIRPRRSSAESSVLDSPLLQFQIDQEGPKPEVIELNSDPVSEHELEAGDQMLQREQKRIKYVLPASWLKIDCEAQKRRLDRLSNLQRRSRTSMGQQQRGVARKVRRPSGAHRGTSPLPVLVDDGPVSPTPSSPPLSSVFRASPSMDLGTPLAVRTSPQRGSLSYSAHPRGAISSAGRGGVAASESVSPSSWRALVVDRVRSLNTGQRRARNENLVQQRVRNDQKKPAKPRQRAPDSLAVRPKKKGGSTAHRQTRLNFEPRPAEAEVAPSSRAAQSKRSRYRVEPPPLRVRNAQLETSEQAFNRDHRTAAFRRRINTLTETVARPSRRHDLPLERFLDEDAADPLPHSPDSGGTPAPTNFPSSSPAMDIGSLEHPVELDNGISTTAPTLQGLYPFNTPYATDFGIHPLPMGTKFPPDTFLGSGDFAAALQLTERDMRVVGGKMNVCIGNATLEWGAWTEDVAAANARIPGGIFEAFSTLLSHDQGSTFEEQKRLVAENVEYMLRSVIRYCSKCMAFLDTVDRRSAVLSLQRLIEDTAEHVASFELDGGLRTKCWEYLLVLATQTRLLSNDDVVPVEMQRKSKELRGMTEAELAKAIVPQCFAHLRSLQSGGFDASVSALVVLYHCLEDSGSFWDVLAGAMSINVDNTYSIATLDFHWRNIFTLLPVLEFDAQGQVRVGSRFSSLQQGWSLITPLLARVFQLYPPTSSLPGNTVNDYIRAVFARCAHLQTQWGWCKTEGVLPLIFDFYAHRFLSPLNHEESPTSPPFLSEIESNPPLDVRPEDRSFHIFLKMLATSLHAMRKYSIFTEKKILSKAWRYMPMWEVKPGNTSALRNHHDLLSTLYVASPSGHRPRFNLFQKLVDFSTASREDCRISLRAWATVTSFQASRDEGCEALVQFADAFRDSVTTTVTRYRAARDDEGKRQVASILLDAMISMKRTIRACRTSEAVILLLSNTNLWSPFTPFDATERKLHSVLETALDVVSTALATQPAAPVHQESEESQDYGDIAVVEELAAMQLANNHLSTNIATHIHDPINKLLLNVFGAEEPVPEYILSTLVTLWVQIARSGHKPMETYLDNYSSHSWLQLRDTEQKRKFTPLFVARVVDSLPSIPEGVISIWLTSLVEREAKLKFQHVLTTSLLTHPKSWTETILHNLPFTGRSVTLSELRQRRIPLLGAVLQNIAALTQRSMSPPLRAMQNAMKNNFLSLAPNPQGGSRYIPFLHQIIALLRENHLTVDPFFLDPGCFPLPEEDPGFVTSRLRGYANRIGNFSVKKQFAVFVRTVVTREVVEQEACCAGQVAAALRGERMEGVRGVFWGVVTAYVEVEEVGVLRNKVMQAAAKVMGGLRYEDYWNWEGIFGALRCLGGREVSTGGWEFAAASLTLVEFLRRARGVFDDRVWGVLFRLRGLAEGRVMSQMEVGEEESEFKAFVKKELITAIKEDWIVVNGKTKVRLGRVWRDVPPENEEEKERAKGRYIATYDRIVKGKSGRKGAGVLMGGLV
ncbi:hypothetical protein K470DRAFT_257417 [Piedraia hortae CBS 480.64]|uniref:Uncharacterized protein n=1 Tax=Piedraia hortae CBS 480.64 TaxID=1314780 RepID=A0A6A7C1I2_9PEZI|nr:hypothetical protein K470DRAFT_257417 [Piedraia hortae CBS 480.64]